MKTSGTCIKCQSKEIYSNSNQISRGERSSMAGADGRVRSTLWIHVYVCLNCGYFEEYICPEDLSNEKKMTKLKSDWEKI